MKTYVGLLVLILFAYSCKNSGKHQKEIGQPMDQESLIRINRELVEKDVEKNTDFAKNHKWNYKLLENGLIYEIVKDLPGPLVESGQTVTFSYLISDLNEKPYYSTAESGKLLKFRVDYEEIEQGLNYLSRLLSPGDSVRAILPPFLAFGLSGDGNKIPPRANLVYYLKLEDLE